MQAGNNKVRNNTVRNNKEKNVKAGMYKTKVFVLALALISCLSVTGISAYFTDVDTAANVFTIGKISLELQMPHWDESGTESILPDQEIPKDPRILNNGSNDEYVFLEVIIPYVNARTANDDGTWNEAADVELFSYDLNAADWIQVGQVSKDEEAKTVTYVYAYAQNDTMTVLTKDAATSTLFDYVRFANVENLEVFSTELVINAYGIQTANLEDGDTTIDGVNDDGRIAPADVWSVLHAGRASVQ